MLGRERCSISKPCNLVKVWKPSVDHGAEEYLDTTEKVATDTPPPVR